MLKQYLTLARANIKMEVKKICAIEFADDIDDIMDCLHYVCADKLPSEMMVVEEIKSVFTEYHNNIVTINDNSYPSMLRYTPIAPVILTIKGDVSFMNSRFVALAGSRQTETDDDRKIKAITDTVNKLGLRIASGLAYGSDLLAHLHSIQFGTLAVMPCGINECYPREHRIILDKIIDFGGAIVSEFSFSEPPRQYNFLKRNASLVGISHAVVIARARDIRSGTMSSANFANKFDRHLYTLRMKGTNYGNDHLLKMGKADEIRDLEDFGYSLLIDVAKNEYNDKNPSVRDNFNKRNKNISIFSYNGDKNSLKKEVETMLQFSEKCASLKLTENNLCLLFDICCQELEISCKKDRQEVLKFLLEKIYKQT